MFLIFLESLRPGTCSVSSGGRGTRVLGPTVLSFVHALLVMSIRWRLSDTADVIGTSGRGAPAFCIIVLGPAHAL